MSEQAPLADLDSIERKMQRHVQLRALFCKIIISAVITDPSAAKKAYENVQALDALPHD